ncbi:MAG: dephospho-CoA kinase [Sphingomonadales bacterium]|nr:dephospho-CoA kinase [Sphingomonadales bacterium]NCO48188.1 dephospho-CoA kinase [Sphingomonadales bacterium]NCO99783.1 dephospho-CoA kinase [Sphingomonadales bacterium]NCP28165.1 dephospho-CoA kinase [Sphingomonadales bacterium]NCP42397.1 dephospho-CoA kinase [Sphingomonadales bacterium]
MTSRRPYIIGLTGSIGMGKSTVAQMFVDQGVPLFDADAAVHELQGSGGALVEKIEALFPGSTNSDGVDRQKLGALVLGDPAALQRLERLIHPAVADMRQAFLEKHHDQPLILFDIPLLFEKGGAEGVDHIVVVSANADHQKDRVLARPGMTAERFEQIKSLQMPDADKRQKADSVIDTSLPHAETRQQVQKLVQKLKASLA